jgi:hypothetical protein
MYIALIARDNWQKVNKCDALLWRHDNDCGYIYKGKKYSVLIDTIKDIYEERGFITQVIAIPYAKYINSNSYSNAFSINSTYFYYDFICKMLNKFLSGKFNIDKKCNRVEFYSKILNLSMPKIVIGIQPDIYLCEACSLLNIPIYDMQHGNIESSRILYSGYKFTPKFLTWDESSKNILKETFSNNIDIIVVGHPFLNRFRDMDIKDILVHDCINEYKIKKINDNKNILVSIRTETGESFKFMPEVLINFIKNTATQYNYFIRAHPINQEEQLNFLNKEFSTYKNINFIEATRIPLPLLLNSIDFHITYHSAVAIECALVGIKLFY